MKQAIYLESAGVSDIGKKREHNEDSLIWSSELGLYAVADGMGGHMHGDVASQVAIETLSQQITHYLDEAREIEAQEVCYEIIVDAIAACNRLILQINANNESRIGGGMGTTLVGAYFLKSGKQLITFNIGDSRIYRFRNGDLTQMTRDHTMYQEWVDAGQIGSAPSKNILVKALGLIEDLSADIRLEQVASGDLYLLCSDGLSTLVDDECLQELLHESCRHSPVSICNQLVDLANQNGGNDNITVIVVRVNDAFGVKKDIDSDVQATVRRIASV